MKTKAKHPTDHLFQPLSFSQQNFHSKEFLRPSCKFSRRFGKVNNGRQNGYFMWVIVFERWENENTENSEQYNKRWC